jgi:hypothetical protein
LREIITLQRSDSQRRPFDSILKRGLDVRRDSGGDNCPDEATLAAYCDGSLPAPESARWEEHFSNCARCQGTLAAIARARSAQDIAPARKAGRRWDLYAAALAAAVVGISVAAGLIRNSRSPLSPALHLHRLTESARARNEPQFKAPEAGAQIALNEAANREARATSESNVAPAPPASTAKEFSPSDMERLAPGRDVRTMRRGVGLPSKSAAQAPAGIGSFANGSAESAARPAPQFAERELAMPSASVAGAAGGIAASRAVVPAPAGAPVLGRMAALEMIPVRTADNVERWRLGANGMIQHLEPDGSWQQQTSGVTSALRAGAAPSPSTCWIVGSNGTILRTVDGEHWQTIASPTSVDLVAVTAIDASKATVTATGGNRFATADGGRTWRPL